MADLGVKRMVISNDSLQEYYVQRLSYYDKVYQSPERQDELRYWERHVVSFFSDTKVLEIASGTGYWTRFLARQAKQVTAIDNNGEAITLVKTRYNSKPHIHCQLEDAYDLSESLSTYSAAFAGLWISHVPITRRQAFIAGLHRHLAPGSRVMFIDNTRDQCADLPIIFTDRDGNTFQDRVIDDGTHQKALKNFPTENELIAMIEGYGTDAEFQRLIHYWCFSYTVI